MECNYCGRTFEKGPVNKILKGKKYIFCSEYCFVLKLHKVPTYDIERTYSVVAKSINVPDFKELLEGENNED